jgi:UDP-N-acetylglucosamine pyrophosphorylase
MDSFNTQADTLRYLEKYPDLAQPGFPLDFVQNKYPRLRERDYFPAEFADDNLNWNPPGHGDIYSVLYSSGILKRLLDNDIRYAFVSNADNLGSVIDEKILTWFAQSKIPFAMEVCQRLEMDKKGGHLAQDLNGNLLLREIAQCPETELVQFQDINRYAFFNTNNLWLDLQALYQIMQANQGILLLPLILNPKVVEGERVIQLETAMGAAIQIFAGARAVIEPRSRFAPVKKTNDLLAIWSDAYDLTDDYRIVLHTGMESAPLIDLDARYYSSIDQMQQYFKAGIPSLQKCRFLKVEGQVSFGSRVICEGDVTITAAKPAHLENREISNTMII